jgi:predicted nucleic acid-binding protein
MGVMLDTSVLVAAERGSLRLVPLLEAQGEAPVAIAAITASELLHGCHRAADAGVRARRFAFVEAVLDLVPILPFGLIEARRHAELWAQLARDGTMIGPHDLLIAATALAQGHELATLNRAEFARVAGLRLLPLDRFMA